MNDNYSKLVDIAYKMHSSGQLEDAKLVYEKLLSMFPDNLEVQNLYAQLNFSLKNYEIALKYFISIFEKTNLEEIAKMIASISVKLENYDIAVSYYQKLIDFSPKDYLNYYNLSLCLKKINKISKSLKIAIQGHELNKNDLDLNIHIASLYELKKDFNSAIVYLNNALNINYSEDILYQLGVLHKEIGKYTEAVSYFDKVIQLNPNNKNAMLNIANTYKNINLSDALQIYKDIEKIYPDDLLVKFFIYNVYYEMFDYENAIKVAQNLIDINPNDISYHKMLGDCYFQASEFDKALEVYNRANEIHPNDELIIMSLVEVYYSLSKLDICEKLLKSIGKTSKNFVELSLKKRELKPVINEFYQWNLTKKNDDYGKRKAKRFFYKLNISDKFNISEEEFINQNIDTTKSQNKIFDVFLSKNLKIGEDFSGKNLLIYSMHGIGDFFMFSRYINLAKLKAKSIVLYIPKSIETVVRDSFPFAKIFLFGENVSNELYDCTVSEFTLICHFEGGLKNIPLSHGYLNINDKYAEEKSKLDIFQTDKRKIGLFWQGNPTILLNRSIKLKFLSQLFNLSNTQFYSFQISKIDDESDNLKKTFPLIDLAPQIKDYADTAAFLKNIDLLITIDTSIANLAGAMGIKTYLLLTFDAEWRWFTDTKTTPWYDSVRIFKQTKPNNWEEVITRIYNELQL